MSRNQVAEMSIADVEALAMPILHATMAAYGVGPVEVKKERDFDGTDVWRVVVSVKEKVPVTVVIDASDDLQQALRREGEDRWVYLGTKRLGELDEDEDAG